MIEWGVVRPVDIAQISIVWSSVLASFVENFDAASLAYCSRSPKSIASLLTEYRSAPDRTKESMASGPAYTGRFSAKRTRIIDGGAASRAHIVTRGFECSVAPVL